MLSLFLKKCIMMDVGFEPRTQKKHGLSTTPFVEVISGVLVRLTTHLQKVNQCTQTRPYNIHHWTQFLGTNLLEVSIGRDFGALKGLRSPVVQKPFSPEHGIPSSTSNLARVSSALRDMIQVYHFQGQNVSDSTGSNHYCILYPIIMRCAKFHARKSCKCGLCTKYTTRVPTTQLAKMSIDPKKFVELTADIARMIL